jgi:hypothetical protein
MMRLSEILAITQELGDLVVGFGRKDHIGGTGMCIGDALRDMPDEYREYVMDKVNRILLESREKDKKEPEPDERCGTCLHWRDEVCSAPDIDTDLFPGTMSRSTTPASFNCGTHWEPRQEPEKPQPVASIVFKYDGGEWLHMARSLDIHNPPLCSDLGFERSYFHSPFYEFIINDDLHGNMPQKDEGRLAVTILSGDVLFSGEATVGEYLVDPPHHRLVFKMERDAKFSYIPDKLNPLLGGCPDCDAPTEPRSMPDGIEQWCPVCNVKVERAERQITAGDWWIEPLTQHKDFFRIYGNKGRSPQYATRVCDMVRLEDAQFIVECHRIASNQGE